MCQGCNNKACVTRTGPNRERARGRDPVCGMRVDADTSLALNIDGVRHVFCSTLCMTRFLSARSARAE